MPSSLYRDDDDEDADDDEDDDEDADDDDEEEEEEEDLKERPSCSLAASVVTQLRES